MKIASSETRQRALAAYEQGKATQKEIARLFGVSSRTFQRWCRQYEHERTTHPKARGHRTAVYSGEDLKRLGRTIRNDPGATLEELRERTAKSCSIMAVQRAVVRLGYSLKKRCRPANEIALTLLNAESNGKSGPCAWKAGEWSSSMNPAQKPT